MTFYIQINHESGFGDFFTYFCETYFLAKQLKNNNNNVIFIFNSKSKMDVKNIFNDKSYQYFDEIRIVEFPISKNIHENYEMILPERGGETGNSHWELIGPNGFDEPTTLNYFNLSRSGLLNYTELKDFPELSNHYKEKSLKFKEENNLDNFCVVHFREFDFISDKLNGSLKYELNEHESFELSNDSLEKLKQISNSHNKIFVCSNNVYLKKYIQSKFNNVFCYEDNLDKTIQRTYDDKDYLSHCLIEFFLMSLCEKIYAFSNYSWISNFISYGILHNSIGPVNPYHVNPLVEDCGPFQKNIN
jgi:hypothetical protein